MPSTREPYCLLPDGASDVLTLTDPLPLDSGETLSGVQVAYRTWGQLNAAKSNAIMICHALTADQFAVEDHPVTGKPGWWQHLVGPGKLIDTDRYFVICSNVLGGCMGTTGPSSINPATGKPYGLSLPVITLGDMVRAQARLVDHLGIDRLLAVIGGSMGGMQVLQWAADYPDRVIAAAPIATASRHTPQNIAFHEVGRQAVMADPAWADGDYYETGIRPEKGLAVARMAAHITYLSENSLNRKFGRNLQERDKVGFSFDADFQVESYLRYQGRSFVDRFDANSYLYITRAMDYFDLARGTTLADTYRACKARFLLASFTTDWLYPTVESRHIVRALHAGGADVSFVEIESDKGHDAFLLDEPEFFDVLGGWLKSVAAEQGV
ncbi:homoserine O-acetyltransferase MetX [Aquisalinus flavus]|uniref:Homoserine O-acetyltransferase n=1 Tax=Aquisalinus flavus TaxID=1526572 RepID=A0A8J2V3A3_9PROT|nr:homoserine O-acetyltransferase [Aquisalinus flavus]MBD0426125.1 homoserine O-acetyltransferase [Aquisalinus flavus]UNE48290.1 homoserine O-acetyltransferase [Aquisalinus flavus]GGD10449.1 homoserine O-acetyltransferase [Aquisalinus flavus]